MEETQEDRREIRKCSVELNIKTFAVKMKDEIFEDVQKKQSGRYR